MQWQPFVAGKLYFACLIKNTVLEQPILGSFVKHIWGYSSLTSPMTVANIPHRASGVYISVLLSINHVVRLDYIQVNDLDTQQISTKRSVHINIEADNIVFFFFFFM